MVGPGASGLNDSGATTAVVGSVNNIISAIAVSGSEVYVGGAFIQARGGLANFLSPVGRQQLVHARQRRAGATPSPSR